MLLCISAIAIAVDFFNVFSAINQLAIAFQLVGVALLGVGIWAETGTDSFKNLVSDNPRIFNAVYIIVAAGALLLVVGFLGCCGALTESRCMLATVSSV